MCLSVDELIMPLNSNDREFKFDTQDFERVRALIYEHAGISMSEAKADMVYGRLVRHVRRHEMFSFKEYLDYLVAVDSSAEWQVFVNALTTNLTSFFREAHHFPILAEYLLKKGRPIRIWCSAASSGEEAYSIAITACEAFGTMTPPVDIIATDIDSDILEIARSGMYEASRLDKLSEKRCKQFFLRGSGAHEGSVRIREEVKRLIKFSQLNLLARDWPQMQPFDVIFCRNVMIYFDRATQAKVLSRFVSVLKPDGLLFAGHSENFMVVNNLFRSCGKTVYELNHNVPELSKPSVPAPIKLARQYKYEPISNSIYFDRNFSCEAVKVGPGEYYVTDQDMMITTVLGSCISACIRDTKTGMGGMNHFMLPDNQVQSRDGQIPESMRYGSYAMEVLLNELIKNGVQHENLEAKIFGGGRVMRDMALMNIGERNANFVRKFLKDEGIRIVAEDLNDIYSRKVYFFPRTGKVFVKKLDYSRQQTVIKRENSYANQLKTVDLAGEIELF